MRVADLGRLLRPVVVLFVSAGVLAGCALFSGGAGFERRHPVQITWKDTRWCVPWSLKRVLRRVSQTYGPVVVYSTHRWPGENRRKGGKPKSYHLRCRAVDFALPNHNGSIIEFLKAQREVGGYSRYPQGFYHIDNGPRRTW
jgi:hypothetical protein